jgi:hypothetical protein
MPFVSPRWFLEELGTETVPGVGGAVRGRK